MQRLSIVSPKLDLGKVASKSNHEEAVVHNIIEFQNLMHPRTGTNVSQLIRLLTPKIPSFHDWVWSGCRHRTMQGLICAQRLPHFSDKIRTPTRNK